MGKNMKQRVCGRSPGAPALMLLSMLVLSPGLGAQPEAGYIELETEVISGSQELPRVLYILPWQEPTGRPDIEVRAELAAPDVFRHLYPPAYRRELEYHELLRRLESEE